VLRHPRDRAERAMGACIALFGAVNVVRLALTLPYEGPQRIHELYVPEPLVPLFALYFATLPVAVTLLVANLVNSRLNARLQERATTDELTGALTRRALIEAAPRVLQRAERDGRPMAAMMIDIDHFKAINDRHGHATGDAVLQAVAAALRQQLRPDALLARWGGEEFVIVLGVDDERSTRLVAERLRRAVEAPPAPPAPGAMAKLPAATVSIGVSWFVAEDDLARALARADAAMYRAKRSGRNRVEFAVSGVSRPLDLQPERHGEGHAG
jgi:diguanylate cyclase (GGDEF)-like protein